MMKTSNLLVIGDVNLDVLVRVKRFPVKDDEVEAQSLDRFPGGDAANIAAQAAKLGLRTSLIASIGNDEAGRQLKVALQRLGVDVSAVQSTSNKSTGTVTAIVRSDGERNLITYRGANSDLRLNEMHREFLRAASIVHLSDPQPQIVTALPGLLDADGPEISLDPGAITADRGLDQLDPILRITRYFFTNETELMLLTSAETVEKGAEILLNRGPEFVFLKRGGDGCQVFTRSGNFTAPGIQVNVVDTTGSGDAFDAGMLYALCQKMPLETAARLANITGGLTAEAVGSQSSQPGLQQVMQYLKGGG